jgi:DNA-binding transcriptional MerR regulator
MKNRNLNISQAAEKVGLHPHTLRRWDDRGWLEVPRNYLGYRVFTPKTIEKIKKRKNHLLEVEDAT